MVQMKDFPSCFGESGIQISDSSSSTTNRHTATAQNLVTCVYKYQTQLISGFITVTWIRYLMGQGLSIVIESSNEESLCKVDIKTWLFSKRKGVKNVSTDSQTSLEIHWDLSSAKFGSSPEPLEGFYLAVVLNQQLCLLIGDLENEAHKKIDSSPVFSKGIFLAKKEHIFGRRLYNSKAKFGEKGELHDIRIEHESSDQCLVIYIDSKVVLRVNRLKWKFRGNETILVDGISVEVYWDVYSWLFGNVMDNAVFLFRTRLCGENSWSGRSPRDALSWPGLAGFKDSHNSQGYGFSLILCAWKNE